MRPARAFALGLLHGPAELLPISSSAHAGLLMQGVAPARRKEIEVALHAGTLAALGLPRPRPWLAIATAPAAVAGLLFERRIEERLGTPRGIALGLVAGAVAMVAADRRNPRTSPTDVTVTDALVLGVAQATALVPGVSRHGAALTALRARGYAREEAQLVSREASKPVLLGAAMLKGARVLAHREGLASVGAAAAGSALSTFAARKALDGRGLRAPLWPFAIYRSGLAASVWRHG